MAEQRALIEAYCKSTLSHIPAGAIVEEIWHGDRKLKWRTEGGKLVRILRAGDHLVIADSAHIWCKIRDLLEGVREFEKKGITVHLLDLGVDTSKDLGQFIMEVLSRAWAFEKRRFRIMRMNNPDRIKRLMPRGAYPYTWSNKSRTWFFSQKLRDFAQQVIAWHKVDKMSFREIWLKTLKEKIKVIRPRNGRRSTEWGISRLQRIYHEELNLQVILEAHPDFKFPKKLTKGMEDVYRGRMAQLLGIRAPAGNANEFPLVQPTR